MGHMFILKNHICIPFSHPESYLILLDVGGESYKISKISLHKDGGFDFHFPYNDSKIGILYKTTHDYTQTESHSVISELKEKYSISSKVKLSIHASGFTQFSGPNITSGLHWFTNEPKGLAVFSSPLTNPITTGPTFNMSLSSLEGFAKYAGVPKKREKIIKFSADNIYNGEIQSSLYVLEGFIFTAELLEKVKQLNGEHYLKMRMPNFEDSNAEFYFKIIFLKKINSFMALSMRKVVLDPSLSHSNQLIYSIGGPGGNQRMLHNRPVADLLFAHYPYEDKDKLDSILYAK